jgi:hypothetical protein
MISTVLPIISSVAAVLVGSVVVALRSLKNEHPSASKPLAVGVTSALFVLASPAVSVWLATLNPRLPTIVWYVDLPLPLLIVAPLVACLVAWSLVRHDTDRATAMGAVAIWSWAGLFGSMNTANFCNPGWCGRYGFPFPYYSWSDAIVVWNGEWPDHFHATSLVLNGLVFLAVAILLCRLTSRAEAEKRAA